MRISERTIVALMMGTALLAAPALAFECAPINQPAPSVQPAPSITSKNPPASVSESAASSLSALQNAAEDGDPIAQWKLGRMYAEGNGVAQNDLLAFDYFSRIANAHSKDSPSTPQAQIVANAFVALGWYYLSGIPNSERGRQLRCWRRSGVEKIGNGCHQLRWREWLWDDDAVRHSVCGPIPIVGGNINDGERGVFLSYTLGDLPAGQATRENYIRD